MHAEGPRDAQFLAPMGAQRLRFRRDRNATRRLDRPCGSDATMLTETGTSGIDESLAESVGGVSSGGSSRLGRSCSWLAADSPGPDEGHAARSFVLCADGCRVDAQMQRLERDEPVVQTLPKAMDSWPFLATGSTLRRMLWWHGRAEVAELKQSRFVLAIGRFPTRRRRQTSTSCLSMNATWRLSANARLVTAG